LNHYFEIVTQFINRHSRYLPFATWLTGFLLSFCFLRVDNVFREWLIAALNSTPSVCFRFISVSAPLIIFYIFTLFHYKFLVLLFLFLKAFAHGILWSMVLTCFPSNGWLIGLLLLFSENFSIIFFLIYSFGYFSSHKTLTVQQMLFGLLSLLIISFVDYSFVAPILTSNF